MIILSCGHEVADFDHAYSVITKATARDGEKALLYSTVCGPCEDAYRQRGALFDSNQDAEIWLNSENWQYPTA